MSGYIVPHSDAEAYASAMRTIALRGDRAAMGAAARARVESACTNELQAAGLLRGTDLAIQAPRSARGRR